MLLCTGSFPPSADPDWNNLAVLHRNVLSPRSHFYPYHDETSALSYAPFSSPYVVPLSGIWRFHFALNPWSAPKITGNKPFDTTTRAWADMPVPSMWQLRGYGYPQYTNFVYPWPVEPPGVPTNENETGIYQRDFNLSGGEDTDQYQYRLRFEGVDSAFHVWVNGNPVGYAQGSRNPHEWDISGVVKAGSNIVTVSVYRRCDGSYLEDQDQWWLSGIFRDVLLLRFPAKARIEDFFAHTHLDDDYCDATLTTTLKTSAAEGHTVEVKLLDALGIIVSQSREVITSSSQDITLYAKKPRKWSAEEPYLYNLVISVVGGNHVVAHKIGFRRIEMKNGNLLINGAPVVFYGVNRHEHHPLFGRTVPFDFMERDIQQMKAHNINALRTCHQPNDPRLYDLADKYGLYVMDEADLECHGFGVLDGSPERWTSDNPEWKDAYLDRAEHLVQRDKNRACVVMWSLGNEAFYGQNHAAMYRRIKEIDSSRPVHYEQDQDAVTADVYSRMYSSVEYIVDFVKTPRDKPLILCEYAHAMGNGPGAIKEYIDAFRNHRQLQGGFVWEWANHGLLTRSSNGDTYYAYGGDFGDEPNDGTFVMDGLCSSSHTPLPGLAELARTIQPITASFNQTPLSAEIKNHYSFLTTSHLACVWSVCADGQAINGGIVLPEIQPGQTATVPIPYRLAQSGHKETHIIVRFELKNDTPWAPKGHCIAFEEFCLQPYDRSRYTIPDGIPGPMRVTQKLAKLRVEWRNSIWIMDLVSGDLEWRTGTGMVLIEGGPTLDFYRAPTDNDLGSGDADHWKRFNLHLTKTNVKSVKWESTENTTIITAKVHVSPPSMSWHVEATMTYKIRDGHMELHVDCAAPRNVRDQSARGLPEFYARRGLTFTMPQYQKARWYGLGPGETYKDRGHASFVSIHERPITRLYTRYEVPQETGNRMGTRWVTLHPVTPVDSTTSGGSSVWSLQSYFLTGAPAASQSQTNSSLSYQNESSSADMRGSGSSELRQGTPSSRLFTNSPKPLAGDIFPSDNSSGEYFNPALETGTAFDRSRDNEIAMKVAFVDRPGSFAVLPWTARQLEQAKHPFELEASAGTFLRLDEDHHGLGTGSCGPGVRDEYRCLAEPFAFTLAFEMIDTSGS